MEEPVDMAADANRDSGSFDSACVGVSDDKLAGRLVATPPVDGQCDCIGESAFEEDEASADAAGGAAESGCDGHFCG